jgi:hypothetical protein
MDYKQGLALETQPNTHALVGGGEDGQPPPPRTKSSFRPSLDHATDDRRTLRSRTHATLDKVMRDKTGTLNLKQAVTVPKGDSLDEWFIVNTYDFFNDGTNFLLFHHASHFHHASQSRCCTVSWPTISAHPRHVP